MATADRLLVRARRIQEGLAGAAGADLAATLARQGRLRQERGDLRGAEAAYRRSLDLHRELLGAAHPETLVVQIDLAVVVQVAQRFAEAETLFRDVIARSSSPAQTLDATSRLGYALFLQGRYAEAADILRPALRTWRHTYGDSHPRTLDTMVHLASSLRDPAQLAEAEALGREAHRIRRQLYGDDRVETSYSAMWMAVFLERKGDFEEAERWARRTTGFDATHPQHIETALHLRTLGGILLVRGDTAEAESLLRKGLAVMHARFPPGAHHDEGDILNRLAFVTTERGAADAAAIYAQAVAFERARKAGPYFVTDGYEYLARTAQQRGDLELAKGLYRRAVKLYSGELPDGHPYRVAAAAGLAELE
jgi:tetratricopeptide (TPR) repeat protein